MAENEELHFTVMYRGKVLELKATSGWTLGDLGKNIVDVTGVAAHTVLLILPKRPPLPPMSEQQRTMLVNQSGIAEGMTIRMMGSSSVEVAAASHRINGFSEEDQRARLSLSHVAGSCTPPKGNYNFCDFRTLHLPGIELHPRQEMALKIMRKLASDRGITAIMDKLNEEAVELDWTKAQAHSLSGVKLEDEEEMEVGSSGSARGYKLGGRRDHQMDARTAAVAAALRKLGDTAKTSPYDCKEESKKTASNSSMHVTMPMVRSEPDPDAQDSHSVVGVASGGIETGYAAAEDIIENVPVQSQEPDPDDTSTEPVRHKEPDLDAPKENSTRKEADHDDPIERSAHEEPDPDVAVESVLECLLRSQEPDTDEAFLGATKNEPDPDASVETFSDASEKIQEVDAEAEMKLESLLRYHEPEPEPSLGYFGSNEPDPGEGVDHPLERDEPDPDTVAIILDDPVQMQDGPSGLISRSEPDPDAAIDIVLGVPLRKYELDPNEVSGDYSGKTLPSLVEGVGIALDFPLWRQEPDPDEIEEAIHHSLQIFDSDMVYMHNKSTGNRNARECVGCRHLAGKRMKFSTGNGFTELAKLQMSR